MVDETKMQRWERTLGDLLQELRGVATAYE
jgi:hypothetical protein